jgi:hypothetical protein
VIKLRRTHKLIVALCLLLVFGLQAQASFACQIADYSGPLENCCCDEQEIPGIAADGEPPCCDYSQGVVVKGSDPAQENEAIAVGGSIDYEFDPPPALLAFVSFWLHPRLSAEPLHPLYAVPVHPLGIETYLATQRLRI